MAPFNFPKIAKNNMEFSNQTDCLNCGQPLTHDYCSHCGQPKATRITFRRLILLIQSALFEFKSPFIKNLIGLTLRPAQTCREYIEGKRVKYFNPVRYSFWLLTISLVLAAFLNVDLVAASFDSFGGAEETTVIQDQMENIMRNGMVYFFFIFAFVLACFVRLFFPKNKYNLWEIYLALLLINGHLVILTIIFLLAGIFEMPQVQWALTFVSLLFPAIVVARMYAPIKKRYYTKAILAILVGWIVGSGLLGFAAGVHTGYNGTHMPEDFNKPLSEVRATPVVEK